MEWLTFCQNWSTCCYHLQKKLNFHFWFFPFLGGGGYTGPSLSLDMFPPCTPFPHNPRSTHWMPGPFFPWINWPIHLSLLNEFRIFIRRVPPSLQPWICTHWIPDPMTDWQNQQVKGSVSKYMYCLPPHHNPESTLWMSDPMTDWQNQQVNGSVSEYMYCPPPQSWIHSLDVWSYDRLTESTS